VGSALRFDRELLVAFWGGSGVWAPSGLRLDEEKHDFDYGFDFSEVYRPMADGMATRGACA
jgi:hypothetical protein